MLRRIEPVLTRRGLIQASAALGCGLSVRAEAAAPSRPDVILTVGGNGARAAFRFVNYRARFPFWSPGWADVLAGRPVGFDRVPAEPTLLAAFAPTGAGRGRPRLLVLPQGAEPGVTRDAILIGLPAMDGDGLIVRMPGATAVCGSSDVPMNPLDIAPTICGLAGVPGWPSFVGRDYSALVPAVRG